MKATFIPSDTSRTILKHATGHVVTVNIPDTMNRVVILVGDADYRKIDSLSRRGSKVTDLMTGHDHVLIPAPCGLGCYCAVTFKS